MASSITLDLSPDDSAELSHIADLLHLFHHRNHNQHRRSIWWRHFSSFRKQTSALVQAISLLRAVPKTNLERTLKKTKDAQILSTNNERLLFWQNVMIAKWHYAFSQLIADGRFSTLGLTLLAALAQISQIVGITAELEELGQTEVEKVLEEFGRAQWGSEAVANDKALSHEEDMGEVIIREVETGATNEVEATEIDGSVHAQPVVDVKSITAKKRKAGTSSKPAKKKRRNADAIDDIFG